MHNFPPRTNGTAGQPPPRLLIVMEGVHDVSFLKRLSRVLHRDLAELPDLIDLEARRQVVFISLGVEITREGTQKFASLGLPEFHLYARKSSTEQARREPLVEALQRRPNCTAFLTRKRSFANYLHSQAVLANAGIEVSIDDECDLPQELAHRFFQASGGHGWDDMPYYRRRRHIHYARRWLGTVAVQDMTLDLLSQRDRSSEVIDWLMTIDQLVSAPSLLVSPAEAHDASSLCV